MKDNEPVARSAYDEWRKAMRLRHTENLWSAFIAGWNVCRGMSPHQYRMVDELPEDQRQFVLSMIDSAIETLKSQHQPPRRK